MTVLLAQLAAAAVLYLGGSGQLAEQAVRSHHGDVGTTMVQLTRRWLGAPYRAFSLDQSAQELSLIHISEPTRPY